MAAGNWRFTSDGVASWAGAWVDTAPDPDELHPYVQPTVEGVRVNATTPLPIREPPTGAPLAHGGLTTTGASQTLRTADTTRKYIEIANDGDTGVWVRFEAQAAVFGQGGYVPPKSSNIWNYAGEVRVIAASGLTVGWVAW